MFIFKLTRFGCQTRVQYTHSLWLLCLLIVELHLAEEEDRLAGEQRVKPGITENNFHILDDEKNSKLTTQLSLYLQKTKKEV